LIHNKILGRYAKKYFAVFLFKVSAWLFNHAVCKIGLKKYKGSQIIIDEKCLLFYEMFFYGENHLTHITHGSHPKLLPAGPALHFSTS
jgi:hypothetical protein